MEMTYSMVADFIAHALMFGIAYLIVYLTSMYCS
jgi:hypothetical protein